MSVLALSGFWLYKKIHLWKIQSPNIWIQSQFQQNICTLRPFWKRKTCIFFLSTLTFSFCWKQYTWNSSSDFWRSSAVSVLITVLLKMINKLKYYRVIGLAYCTILKMSTSGYCHIMTTTNTTNATMNHYQKKEKHLILKKDKMPTMPFLALWWIPDY